MEEKKKQKRFFFFDPFKNSMSRMICISCKEPIFNLDERKKGLNFDIHQKCFVCDLDTCKKNLSSKNFFTKNSKCFCSLLHQIEGDLESKRSCEICHKEVKKEDQKRGIKQSVHDKCFECFNP